MNRLGNLCKRDPIISALVIRSAGIACFLFAGIYLSIAAEPDSSWAQFSEEDSVIRSRWSTERIDQVLASLTKPDTALPVMQVPDEILVRDLPILARAHGIYGLDEPLNWYIKHDPALRYSDLRGIGLKDCMLESVDLRYTYLEGADLSKCKLENADLTGANLRGANLSGAILKNAILDHIILIDADLSGANLAGASLRQALFYDAKLVEANLTGANLEEAQFADFLQTTVLKKLTGYLGSGEMEQTPLLRAANLSGSNLWGTNLSGAILGNANLEGASLYESIFGNTLIDVRELDKAFNYRYIKPGTSAVRINIPDENLLFAEAFHREAKRFFASNGMDEMEAEYHFWEQESKTYKPETPLLSKSARIAFLKWPYGYSSRPMWLFYYSFSVVLIFGMLYLLLTINRKKSGIYRVHRENGEEKLVLLSWRKGLLLADCLYFSLLSLATFGYGVFKPSQWIEFFRFEPVQLRPLGWARILVGLEAAVGIYLLALLTTVLFGKG